MPTRSGVSVLQLDLDLVGGLGAALSGRRALDLDLGLALLVELLLEPVSRLALELCLDLGLLVRGELVRGVLGLLALRDQGRGDARGGEELDLLSQLLFLRRQVERQRLWSRSRSRSWKRP